ncbi:hypothetical protein AXF42_Ash008376 [Apostasia shenzhenica]|uniref:Uncharacterized protein n=1 Tax=Apostasia shenzhenica TaxID=1088818 RepID=A0A2I0AXP1_9ASPA|nr:hypothetical protein AXF42_Ash008376 [Apostasia shenzhenica]
MTPRLLRRFRPRRAELPSADPASPSHVRVTSFHELRQRCIAPSQTGSFHRSPPPASPGRVHVQQIPRFPRHVGHVVALVRQLSLPLPLL